MNQSSAFSPFQLKNFTLKNRLGVAPMTRMSGSEDSIPRKDVLDFLIRRARNGAGIVFTEAIVTDYESAQGYPGQSRMLNQNQIDAWRPVAEAIKKEGALGIMQIFHCGRMSWPEVNPARRVIAPSPLTPKQNNPLTGVPYSVPEEMTQFDIDHVINGFTETAKGAIAAGFEGVEIHGAHGYLISQFLSSYTNNRKDGYGGSVKNRYRFAHEVISAVRKEIPADRLLTFRISNWGIADMEVSLFKNKEEYQEIIEYLSQEPIDALSVSTYNFRDHAFETGQTMSGLTREVSNLPIMICGKIHDRESAEEALKEADVVLSGKSMLLNPHWVEDIRNHKILPVYSSSEANIAYTEEALL